MATSIINAKDVVVKRNGVMIGCAKSATLKMTTDVSEATCASSGAYKEYTPGYKSWTASINAIYREFTAPDNTTNVSFDDIFSNYDNGDVITLEFGKKDGTGSRFHGSAFVSSLTLNFPEKDACDWSADLQGTGAISKI